LFKGVSEGATWFRSGPSSLGHHRGTRRWPFHCGVAAFGVSLVVGAGLGSGAFLDFSVSWAAPWFVRRTDCQHGHGLDCLGFFGGLVLGRCTAFRALSGCHGSIGGHAAGRCPACVAVFFFFFWFLWYSALYRVRVPFSTSRPSRRRRGLLVALIVGLIRIRIARVSWSLLRLRGRTGVSSVSGAVVVWVLSSTPVGCLDSVWVQVAGAWCLACGAALGTSSVFSAVVGRG
jgi:hypothetical protein